MDDKAKNLVVKLLKENKTAIHPGRGKQNALLVREICEELELDEREFMPKHVLRDPKKWGLCHE